MTGYLRSADVRSRRLADVADRGLGRLSWADSAPTRATSGTTAVRAKADVPLRARSRLHRPQQALFELPTEHREGRRAAGRWPPGHRVHGEWGEGYGRSASICWYRNFGSCQPGGRAVRACDPPQTQSGDQVAAQKGAYSISSSTRATNDGDNVTPSARAVARLIDRRNR